MPDDIGAMLPMQETNLKNCKANMTTTDKDLATIREFKTTTEVRSTMPVPSHCLGTVQLGWHLMDRPCRAHSNAAQVNIARIYNYDIAKKKGTASRPVAASSTAAG